MSVFETQGKYAALAEPLSEWLDTHGINTRVNSVMNANEAQQRDAWNQVLLSPDTQHTVLAIRRLRKLEHEANEAREQ